MTRLRTAMFATLALAAPASAKDLPEPLSFAMSVADGKYVFVGLGPAEVDAKSKDPADRVKLAALRAKYPRSGLYPAGGTDPLWTVSGYAPSENTFVAADGVHLVRVEGDWWRTKEYTYQNNRRLPPEREQALLDAPAVSFFTNGQLTKSYAVRDLVSVPADLKHTPETVLWYAGAVLNEGAGKFVVHTQDANRIAFDAGTGRVLSRDRVGLNNPLAGRVLMLGLGLTLVILAVWAWLVFGRRRADAPDMSGSPPATAASSTPA